ncbi:hypothetical protein SMICM304S_04128 [Streptomyces microflavus]
MPPPYGHFPPPGPVRAEAGRHDQQGRNGQGGRFGWLGELSLVLLLVVVGILVVSGIGAVLAEALDAGPASADSEVFFEDPVAYMALQLVGIAIGIPIVLWGARYLGKRPGHRPGGADRAGHGGGGRGDRGALDLLAGPAASPGTCAGAG